MKMRAKWVSLSLYLALILTHTHTHTGGMANKYCADTAAAVKAMAAEGMHNVHFLNLTMAGADTAANMSTEGCPGTRGSHPSWRSHELMAEAAEDVVRKVMRWPLNPVLLPSTRSIASSICGAPSSVCIRGSPGVPAPGKDTIKKFDAGDPESASIGACCAAASSVKGCVAVQLVAKLGKQPECWLMGQPHASKSVKLKCISAQVAPTPVPPTPVPRRQGPLQLPREGSARGIVNLGGGPMARAVDPAFERFQQIDLQWADIEPEEGVYNWTLPEALALSINATGRMAVFKVNANIKPSWIYNR